MKTLKYILLILILGAVVFLATQKKEDKINEAPVVDGQGAHKSELCFAEYGTPGENGFYDKFTLRLAMEGEKASGELRLLPAEKDSLVGKFEGTVGAVDKTMMARTADLIWSTEGEGMTAKQELRVIFGEGTANVGFGEMVLDESGVYRYKDVANADYSLSLTDVSCGDLSERENVEKYLRGNIATLSLVKPVLGGSWYILSVNIDLVKNSGEVTYEDGHVQEKRSFTYTTDQNGAILSLVIN